MGRPYVICPMEESLDGKVTGELLTDRTAVPARQSRPLSLRACGPESSAPKGRAKGGRGTPANNRQTH